MNPTQEQLDTRLQANPTPVQYATDGIFRVAGSDGQIYKRTGDTVSAFDVTSLLSNEERGSIGNYGAQTSEGLNRLKSTYGLDFNSLSQVNLADMFQADNTLKRANNVGYANILSDINQFVTAKPAQLQQGVLNATGNQLASPEKIAEAQATIPTSQTIESGIKNLGIPQTNLQPGATGDEVKKLQDFLVKEGLMTQAQVNTGYGTYGPQTTAAVKALQEKYGLDAGANAGYFGPQTRSALTKGSSIDTPSTISSSELQAKQINLPTGSVPKATAEQTMAGAQATLGSLQEYINLLTAPETDKSNKVDSLRSELDQMLGGLEGRGASQLEAERQLGVQEKKQGQQNTKLSKLNTKLSMLK